MMNETSYRVDFRQLKQRVGIDDVAYSLGYRLDRSAGVGRYIELVLGDGRSKQDTIIIANHRDKGAQAFFRRDGSKGDVVSFIRENIDKFNAGTGNEWQRIGRVLSNFANMPQSDHEDRDYIRDSYAESQEFDKSRYTVRPIDPARTNQLLVSRGLDEATVRMFAPHLALIRDIRNDKFKGYNIGFVYTDESDNITGYEIRGNNGYKSKAAGTDSSTSAWIADLSGGNPMGVSNVFFFESAFDAMAFWQINRTRLTAENTALVSLGGTFADGQVMSVLRRFPESRLVSCFDNDEAGRRYSDRFAALARESSRAYGNRPAPDGYKDWNDNLLGKRMTPTATLSRYQCEENLAERRKNGMKL